MQKFTNVLNKLYPIFLLLIFAIGFYLRTKVYLTNLSFWHDECALAWNILNKNYLELFQPLRFLQAAPLFFLLFTKVGTEIFGYNELVFRFIPYVSGILSIIAFYFLSKSVLTHKYSVLFSNLVFALCVPLFYYSGEFKPYSSDVLFCIFSILIFLNLNKKNLLWLSAVMGIFIWFSFPEAFIIFTMVLIVLLNKAYSLKEKLLFLFSQVINGILFYIIFFKNMFNTQKSGMIDYWSNYFINAHNFIDIMQQAFNFMFLESKILIILSILGLLLFLKSNHKFGKFVSVLLIVLFLVSMFKMYPFAGRLILFLIPIFILLISKSIDNKNAFTIVFLSLFLLGFYPDFKTTLNTIVSDKYNKYNANPREMVEYMFSKIKNTDIVYVNIPSNCDYLYYKQIYNIKNKELIGIPQYINIGDKVWFFLVNNSEETYEKIIENNYKIFYENQAENSKLIYAEKIK